MRILREFVPSEMKNRPGITLKVRKITIHNTSNNGLGANAKSHSKLVREKGYNGRKPDGTPNWVSWHYTVDDVYIIQQLPLEEQGLHAGTNGNAISLAIEVCMHNGINQNLANDNTAKLVAALCKKYNLNITNDVVTHNKWTGKNCPVLLLPRWEFFLKDVKLHLKNNTYILLEQSVDSLKIEDPQTDEIIDIRSPMCWAEENTS